MTNRIKVTQYFFTNLIDSAHSSFYIERRPRGKWLCYRESNIVMAQMMVSKKSFQSLMRFTSGVQCQKYIDDTTGEEDIGDSFDQDDDGLVEAMWSQHRRSGKHYPRQNFLPATITPTIKKEPAPFITQIFIPS